MSRLRARRWLRGDGGDRRGLGGVIGHVPACRDSAQRDGVRDRQTDDLGPCPSRSGCGLDYTPAWSGVAGGLPEDSLSLIAWARATHSTSIDESPGSSLLKASARAATRPTWDRPSRWTRERAGRTASRRCLRGLAGRCRSNAAIFFRRPRKVVRIRAIPSGRS